MVFLQITRNVLHPVLYEVCVASCAITIWRTVHNELRRLRSLHGCLWTLFWCYHVFCRYLGIVRKEQISQAGHYSPKDRQVS